MIRRYLRNPRVLGAAGLVLALLAAALWPKAIQADVAAVSKGTMQVTVDEEGETRVRERFVVSAPVAGRVLRIELEPGDAVTRGTPLATFLPAAPVLLDARTRAEARAALAAAQAAVGRAAAEQARTKAALQLARSEVERYRALAAQQLVSAEALDTREAEFRTAEEAARAAGFAVGAAEHERDMARARLDPPAQSGGSIRIVSPVDGAVLRRLRESEAVVGAGEALLELGDPGDIEIVSDLLSPDAVRVKAGDPVIIDQWGGDRPLRGRVRRVEPSGFMKISALGVEEQRVNVIVDVEDREQAGSALGDGYRVEVRIVIWEGRDAVKAPATALFRQGEGWAAYAVEGGRARLRAVGVGHRNGLEAEITSGLSAGDRVVVHPSDSISDGVRVTGS